MMAIVGCAFNPQQANFEPPLEVIASDIGNNAYLSIQVADDRPSQSLGRRASGYGPAAEITAAQDLTVVIRDKLSQGFSAKKFKVEDVSGTDNVANMKVELRALEYSTSTGFWTGGIHINGAIKLTATRHNREFEKFYRSENEQRIVIVPDATTNEKWLNEALGGLLTQIIEDEELLVFLAALD